jgi:hypothetical protein
MKALTGGLRVMAAASAAAFIACGASPDGAVPAGGVDTVEVNVVDTLGILTGDSTRVFGTITQASWGSDGKLYVLDGQLGRLAVFGPDLGFRRFVGRLGAGPGEFQYPQSFAFLGDGRLVVCDWGAGSVVFFDSTLGYVDRLSGYYPDSPRCVVPGPGGTYVAMNMSLEQDGGDITGNSFIARFGPGMEPEHVYESWPLMISVYGDPDDPDVSIGRVDHDFDTDMDGTLYLAERDDSTYLVEAFPAEGVPDTLVNRTWVRVEKTEEQKEEEFYEETRDQDADMNQMGRRALQNIYPYMNAIGSVDVDPDGNVWVGQGYTDTPTFEVYAPSGDLLCVAVIPELTGVKGLEFCFRNGFLAYDRQPEDYPKVYILESGACVPAGLDRCAPADDPVPVEGQYD